ncbi:endonuclease V [Shewanella sp. NFH-SH190041]|uniref:endonuclease V n=1 Tax=Shewanella sp. NFH-SH190041 TaxID=2950245 RepID=UPI0021C40209|nr:endonuclease V [Shewanella sp. NFH-SH190041]BDM65456.1 endonuclease V [Shewanella sp. NFH-SH190041]
MILAIDVQYHQDEAFIAGILFESWQSTSAVAEYTSKVSGVADYIPGQFYRRELPCILTLLTEHQLTPEVIIVDGYVFLDDQKKPGLGKHLFDALDGKSQIIGVAKKPFSGLSPQCRLLRGKSDKPLFITTTGDQALALTAIGSMAGNFRLPTLLKRADTLCREQAKQMQTCG